MSNPLTISSNAPHDLAVHGQEPLSAAQEGHAAPAPVLVAQESGRSLAALEQNDATRGLNTSVGRFASTSPRTSTSVPQRSQVTLPNEIVENLIVVADLTAPEGQVEAAEEELITQFAENPEYLAALENMDQNELAALTQWTGISDTEPLRETLRFVGPIAREQRMQNVLNDEVIQDIEAVTIGIDDPNTDIGEYDLARERLLNNPDLFPVLSELSNADVGQFWGISDDNLEYLHLMQDLRNAH